MTRSATVATRTQAPTLHYVERTDIFQLALLEHAEPIADMTPVRRLTAAATLCGRRCRLRVRTAAVIAADRPLQLPTEADARRRLLLLAKMHRRAGLRRRLHSSRLWRSM